jgi:hypothetical protein
MVEVALTGDGEESAGAAVIRLTPALVARQEGAKAKGRGGAVPGPRGDDVPGG